MNTITTEKFENSIVLLSSGSCLRAIQDSDIYFPHNCTIVAPEKFKYNLNTGAKINTLNTTKFSVKENQYVIDQFNTGKTVIFLLCDRKKAALYKNVINFARELKPSQIYGVEPDLQTLEFQTSISNWKEKTKNKRLIFTVSPGRCGTKFLAQALALLQDVAASHEPKPRFSDWLRAVQRHPEIATKFWREKKLPWLAQFAAPTYVETSHIICKGFLDALAEMDYKFDLIFLSRPHREVARSMYKINSIPGRSFIGLEFNLSPEDPVELPLENWRNFNDYQLCYWYCLEMEERAKKLRRKFRQDCPHIFKTSLNKITTKENYVNLLEKFELEYNSEILDYFSKLNKRKINEKKNTKKQKNLSTLPEKTVLKQWEKEVENTIEKKK